MEAPPAATTLADRADNAIDLVSDWLFGSAMGELIDMFSQRRVPDATDWTSWVHLNEELPSWLETVVARPGESVHGLSPAQTDILRRALTIERLAASEFNFRSPDGSSYRERSQAIQAEFSDETRARVLDLTRELGLVDARPPRLASYDKTLVLGGGYRSPLLRTRYAAQLQASGVALGEISFLGSPRFLIEEPPERPIAMEYAPDAVDEFGLMVGAVRAEFGLVPRDAILLCGCTSTDVQCPNWPYRNAKGADETPPAFTHERQAPLVADDGRVVGSVLSASTGRPPYRPDTSDTLRLWAQRAHPRLGQRVLVVTTQVFVPFQMFDSIRRLYLPFGVDVDAVGFGADWGDRPQTAEFLLQETLSAIRSARRLLVDAAETSGRARSA